MEQEAGFTKLFTKWDSRHKETLKNHSQVNSALFGIYPYQTMHRRQVSTVEMAFGLFLLSTG
jgi:hypothetical protein